MTAVGLDERLRGSAAVPPAELDVADVARRARRMRWTRRLLLAACAVGLAAVALGAVQLL